MLLERHGNDSVIQVMRSICNLQLTAIYGKAVFQPVGVYFNDVGTGTENAGAMRSKRFIARENSNLIGQQSLELAVGIVKAGAQGAFRDIDELGNLGVGEPLDIAEIHDFLMGRGEL